VPTPEDSETWLKIGQIVIYVLGIAGVLWRMSGMAKSFEMRGHEQAKQIDKLELAVLKLNDVVIQQAVSTARLDNQGVQITQLLAEMSALHRERG
jgi:hypothetical protein